MRKFIVLVVLCAIASAIMKHGFSVEDTATRLFLVTSGGCVFMIAGMILKSK